jgi:low affinity Fe/Cu permease
MKRGTPSRDEEPKESKLDLRKRLRDELKLGEEAPLVDRPNLFERLAEVASVWISSTWGLVAATSVFIGWLVAGPFCGWGEAWYYVDAVIAFATFVFVFLLQRAQRKDSMAIHTKLNELLAAVERASPRLINLEDQSEEEVDALHKKFEELQEMDSQPRSIEDCNPDGDQEGAEAKGNE